MRKRTRVAMGISAMTVAALVIPAAAAQASDGSRALWCIDGTTAAGQTGGEARGDGILREPTLNVQYEQLPAEAVGKGKKWDAVVTVPVWFHVVHDDGIGNVSDAAIDRQIRIMNLAYSGFYGGFDQGFQFELVGVTRTNNAEWFYAGATTPGEREMKRTLRRGDMGTLNYYSTTAGAYLGWAYLPGLNDAQAYLDGIVVDWESMNKTSDRYQDRYDLGFTAVHETGHWLGLEHTFYGGCNAKGDYVDDTPAMKTPTSGCPADGTKDTCPRDPGFDPIHNFMDYSYDLCYEELTQGQAERARDHWLAFRS